MRLTDKTYRRKKKKEAAATSVYQEVEEGSADREGTWHLCEQSIVNFVRNCGIREHSVTASERVGVVEEKNGVQLDGFKGALMVTVH